MVVKLFSVLPVVLRSLKFLDLVSLKGNMDYFLAVDSLLLLYLKLRKKLKQKTGKTKYTQSELPTPHLLRLMVSQQHITSKPQ